MGAFIETLRDDFADNSEAAAWSSSYNLGSAVRSEASGQARFTLPSSTAGTHDTAYFSGAPYDLTGGSASWNIAQMVSTAVAAYAFFKLLLDGANFVEWVQQSGTIKARKVVAGVSTDLFSAAWSATTYKYLRIREAGGTIFVDSSTDGISWTNRASIVGLPFAITNVFITFGAGCGNVASPGALHVEDFNLIRPALTTNWRHIQQKWPLRWRFRNTTVAIDAANTVQACVVTADEVDVAGNPTTNVRYWAGPMNAGRVLTEQPSLAAAQAMAVNVPLDGRLDLSVMVECRIIRTYFRSIDGAALTWRELYSRRLGQFDDLEAEIIKGMTVLGHQFVCDELSALSANVGTLTAGTLDGVTIIAGTNDEVTLDDAGIGIIASTLSLSDQSYKFVRTNGTTLGFWVVRDNTVSSVLSGTLQVGQLAGFDSTLTLRAQVPSGENPTVTLEALESPSNAARVIVNANSSGRTVTLLGDTTIGDGVTNLDDLTVTGGLNVGTATGAASGQVRASAGVFPSYGAGTAQFQARDITSLANGGTAQLVNASGDEFGMVLIFNANNGQMAFYTLRGGAHATQEVSDPGAVFSPTSGTGSSTNIYWSAGNSRYELQNNTGGTATYRVIYFKY